MDSAGCTRKILFTGLVYTNAGYPESKLTNQSACKTLSTGLVYTNAGYPESK